MRFLITGAAGFIGFHVAKRLLAEGHHVVGVDGFTPYYDQSLKRRRHDLLCELSGFSSEELHLENTEGLFACIQQASPEVVIHLAAQPGVRYSAENSRAYIDANVVGTFNLLEALKRFPCKHLLIASTSSVYGDRGGQACHEATPTDRPLSLYAATKIATEALAFSQAHLGHIPTTVVRLFTVYGPWGRPDMALFKFTKSILEERAIDVYGFGKMRRDFTYVDDVVEAIRRLVERPPTLEASTPEASNLKPDANVIVPYQVVNIGYGQPVELQDFIAAIERKTGKKALRRELPMQPGDVPSTWADIGKLTQLTGYKPSTPLVQGVDEFVAWYRGYYQA